MTRLTLCVADDASPKYTQSPELGEWHVQGIHARKELGVVGGQPARKVKKGQMFEPNGSLR